MEKFREITECSFGWSAQDHETRLLLPKAAATIRSFAPRDTAVRGTSKCQVCGIRIGKGMQRCVFRWLDPWGWSGPCFLHAAAEDCAKVQVLDAREQAEYIARTSLAEARLNAARAGLR